MKQSLEFLRERITDKMPLEEMVAIFEDLCREPIEDEMILFETGTFTSISDKPLFQLSLVRQAPMKMKSFIKFTSIFSMKHVKRMKYFMNRSGMKI